VDAYLHYQTAGGTLTSQAQFVARIHLLHPHDFQEHCSKYGFTQPQVSELIETPDATHNNVDQCKISERLMEVREYLIRACQRHQEFLEKSTMFDFYDETKIERVSIQTNPSNENDNVLNDEFSILSILLGDNTPGGNVTTKDKIKKGKVLTGKKVKIMIMKDIKDEVDRDIILTNDDLNIDEDSKNYKNLSTTKNITGETTRLKITNQIDSTLLLLLVDTPLMEEKDTILDNKNGRNCIEPCSNTSFVFNNYSTDNMTLSLKEEQQLHTVGDKLDKNVQKGNIKSSYPYYPIKYFPP